MFPSRWFTPMSTSLETIRRVKSNDPHLHELTISDVVLGDARITLLLASALRDNAHIRHVIISEGGRRVLERADAILDALSSANVVCKITVGPRRGDYVPEQRPAIAMAVADRLHSLASLVKLDLNGCLIGPVGAARLASSLEGNATMTQLLVSDNDIGDEGAAALGRMLRKNGALVEVIMDANDITPRGQRELRNAIYDDSSFAALGGSNHRLESYFHNPRSVFGPCVMNDVLAALASNLRSKSARQAVTKKLTRLLQRRYGVRLQGASFLNVESVFMPPILEWREVPGARRDYLDKYHDVGNEDVDMYRTVLRSGVGCMCVNRPDVMVRALAEARFESIRSLPEHKTAGVEF